MKTIMHYYDGDGLVNEGSVNPPNFERSEIPLYQGQVVREEPQVSKQQSQIQYGTLEVRDMDGWFTLARDKPNPNTLFDKLWFEGELSILFAETNVGKSILGVQIADSITKGIPIPDLEPVKSASSVLFLDFEMSDKQWEARYSNNYENHYRFNEKFQRAKFNPKNAYQELGQGVADLFVSIEQVILGRSIKVLIVDNLTWLADDHEKTSNASSLMKRLKGFNEDYGISILVLAHTPKRDSSRPLTVNDLQGSRMIGNFADSIFAIGKSCHGPSSRYLKQIKARNTDIVYGEDNVMLFNIEKPDNVLQFTFQGLGFEQEHLQRFEAHPVVFDFERLQLAGRAKELVAEGKSQREIGDLLGKSAATVNRLLKS